MSGKSEEGKMRKETVITPILPTRVCRKTVSLSYLPWDQELRPWWFGRDLIDLDLKRITLSSSK